MAAVYEIKSIDRLREYWTLLTMWRFSLAVWAAGIRDAVKLSRLDISRRASQTIEEYPNGIQVSSVTNYFTQPGSKYSVQSETELVN